jgi:hypothetical protein
MSRWRISRMPGSGNGSETPFQYEITRLRTELTALNAGWLVSSSFLPADKNAPSAPNDSAAWDFCSAVRVFRVPNQLMLMRTAAIVVRNRSVGEADGRVGISSSNVLLQRFSKVESKRAKKGHTASGGLRRPLRRANPGSR